MGKKPFTKGRTAGGSVVTYTVGFVLSVILTIEAYLAVTKGLFGARTLIAFIAALAVVQLAVQLIFFLHMDSEARQRWNLVIFLFALMVIGIVVIGSLWIMNNLDYNMMPHQVDQYLMGEEGIHRNEHTTHY